ncbi:hypothetical protein [Arhodomonas sp. SL1]|uniref:hypothetical protein n=1 Tax=Arhodomonas sp. SL1 TaxID=3425691 RepID=UPI003F884006
MGKSPHSSSASATSCDLYLAPSAWVAATLVGTHAAAAVPVPLLPGVPAWVALLWCLAVTLNGGRLLRCHVAPRRGRHPGRRLVLHGDGHLWLDGGTGWVRVTDHARRGPLVVIRYRDGHASGRLLLARDGVDDWRGLCRVLQAMR